MCPVIVKKKDLLVFEAMSEFKIFETSGMTFSHQWHWHFFCFGGMNKIIFFSIPLAKNKKFTCFAEEERNEKKERFSFVVNERNYKEIHL